MNKIAIIGSSGAGKSTLARRLGEILQITVYHLDAFYWKSGWIESTDDEFSQIQQKIITKEHWIIDGNYGRTMDTRLKHADTIIFLNLSRFICLDRVFKRRIQYRNRTRPDMGKGCLEKLDLEFLAWIWNYPKVKKPKILGKLRHYSSQKQIIILHSTKEVANFISKLKSNSSH